MSIKSRLDKLFKKWEMEVPGYQGHFIKDGVINEALYLKQETKILFIMKEPNNPEQESHDFAAWFDEEIRYTFAHRLGEWAYGLLNNFPPYLESRVYENKHEAFKSVAFLNLKKTGGSGSANGETIKKHTRLSSRFILKQIEILEPDIIVGGIGSTGLWRDFLGDFELVDSGCDIWVFRWRNARVIDFYHPSNRYPRAMSYSLLQNVCQSEPFVGLKEL